jgi:hypothetical protein
MNRIIILWCLLTVSEFSYSEEIAAIKNGKPTYVKVFGGLLVLPQNLYLKSESLSEGQMVFTNLEVFENYAANPVGVTIAIGEFDSETEKVVKSPLAGRVSSCYGFNQVAVNLKGLEGQKKVYVTVMYDDKNYVRVTSADKLIVSYMTQWFKLKYGDCKFNLDE